MPTATTLTIGKLAKQAGVGVETVRFYERVGLLDEPPRTPAGYRQYPPRALDRLRFIRRAKRVGFSIREIRELLALRASDGASADDVRHLARERIQEVESRIEELREIRRALREITARCDGRGSIDDCVILAALETSEDE